MLFPTAPLLLASRPLNRYLLVADTGHTGLPLFMEGALTTGLPSQLVEESTRPPGSEPLPLWYYTDGL